MKMPFSNGGPQEMLCLRLDLVHGWLFTVDSAPNSRQIRSRKGPNVSQRNVIAFFADHFLW